jgi:hypothetical protein
VNFTRFGPFSALLLPFFCTHHVAPCTSKRQDCHCQFFFSLPFAGNFAAAQRFLIIGRCVRREEIDLSTVVKKETTSELLPKITQHAAPVSAPDCVSHPDSGSR